MTEILRPGPISKGTFENSALRGTDLELIDEMREFKSVMPSPPEVEVLVAACGNAGASGSVGEAL